MLWVLLSINGGVFLFELHLSEAQVEQFFSLFGLVPARYSHPDWTHRAGLPINDYWRFFTHMFLHGSWLHFLGNMWTLWI